MRVSRLLILLAFIVDFGTSTLLSKREENLDIIIPFIKKVQTERKSPCVLHLIEVDIDFKKIQNDDNFLFQHHSKNPIIKPDMGCNILISSSEFVSQLEALKIEKSIKNHVWIIIGKYENNQFSWPVLEVQSKISKLHCPGEEERLILQNKITTCPEFPTWNGKDIKVSVLGLPSDYRQLPNGKFIGYYPETIEMLSTYMDFKPEFMVKAKTNDDSVRLVQNGTVDLGVHITISQNRLDKTDMPSYIDYEELVYIVPIPKPVDVFYQLLQPFDMQVWIGWLSTLAAFCVLLLITVKMFDQMLQLESSYLKLIDFVLYPIGITIQPLHETKWIKSLWSNSSNGIISIGNTQLYFTN